MRKVFWGAVALLLAASCQFSMSGLKTSTSVDGSSSGGQPSSSSTPPAKDFAPPLERSAPITASCSS